jgi:glycosyltransferase involved in cell wall biosynthesis
MVLVSYFPPQWEAGTELEVLALSHYLAARGFEVHVVTRSLTISPSSEKLAEHLTVHRVFCPKPQSVTSFLSYSVSALLLALQIRPHIIQGVTLFPNGFVAGFIGRLLRIPVIAHAMGSDVFRESPLIRIIFWQSIFQSASAIISKAELMSKEMERHGAPRHKIVKIYSGVELNNFALNRSHCRGLIGADNDQIIVSVGRLEPVKGIQNLLKAFPQVQAEFPDSKLIIVGGGSEEERLREIMLQSEVRGVQFCGHVKPIDVPTYLIGADIFALPSLSEGCPAAVLEAMAAGLPIVASKVGAVPELIRHGKEGFLVPPSDVRGLAEHIKILLANPELRRTMSHNCKTRARNYAHSSINEQTVHLSLALLERKHNANVKNVLPIPGRTTPDATT